MPMLKNLLRDKCLEYQDMFATWGIPLNMAWFETIRFYNLWFHKMQRKPPKYNSVTFLGEGVSAILNNVAMLIFVINLHFTN